MFWTFVALFMVSLAAVGLVLVFEESRQARRRPTVHAGAVASSVPAARIVARVTTREHLYQGGESTVPIATMRVPRWEPARHRREVT